MKTPILTSTPDKVSCPIVSTVKIDTKYLPVQIIPPAMTKKSKTKKNFNITEIFYAFFPYHDII